MRLSVLFVIVCLLCSTPPALRVAVAEADLPGTIVGTVTDLATGQPLAGANIAVEGTSRRTVTDHDGKFHIEQLPPGKYNLIIDYIGYALQRRDGIRVTSNETVDLNAIKMETQPISLSEIVVTPGTYSMMGGQRSIRQTLTSEDIKIMGWAEDITRAVQRIPGTASDEYAAQFSIRGGETDEILVLLDGMRIYKPFHQKDFGGGLFSTVDIETIDQVDLLTGGFTADYGDGMSGVLSMKTKTPDPGERRTSVGLSLMNVHAFSMGTFNGNKGSWLVSGRRAYLDLLDRLMKSEFKLKPNYFDLLGKLQLKLNPRHTLSVYGFLANDSYELNERVRESGTTWDNTDFVDTKYGNAYGWLTLKSLLSDRVHARMILYGGLVTQNRDWDVFDNDPQAHLSSAKLRDERDLGLVGLKQDWDLQASSDVLLRFGLDVKKLDAKYSYSNSIRNEFITTGDSLIEQVSEFEADKEQNGTQAAAYLSSRFKVLPALTLETGFRYDHVSYTDDRLWSPRISGAYALSRETFLRAGWGYYYQPQSIDDLDIQFEDLRYHPAEMAEHFVLGFEQLIDGGLHFRAEAYYKKMSDLRDSYYTFRDIDEFFPEARDDLIRLSLNKATARGIELLLKRDTGDRLAWWMSYVLSKAEDDVAGIDYDGRLVKKTGILPRAWDQRHTLNIDANYRLSDRWHFNVAWKYRTGWPSTDFTVKRIQREDGTFAYYHDQGVFRGSRVPSYQRLDLRVNRHFYPSRGKVAVFLQVINLYNHENVIRYDHEILEQDAETFRYAIEPESWFGILPFLGVNWEF